MADIGNTDFTLKQSFDPSLLASLYQRKVAEEQTAKLQQSEMESQQQNRTMETVKLASLMTQNLIAHSANQQLKQGRDALATILPPGQREIFLANPEAATKELAASAFNPKTPAQPKRTIKEIQNPDGSIGYAIIDEGTGQATPVKDLKAPSSSLNAPVTLSDTDRQPGSPIDSGAKALVEGRATPSQLANLRTPNGQKMVQRALEIDPNYDVSLAGQRSQVRKEFTTGPSAKNLTSNNTLIGHLDTLQEAGDALDNSKLRKYNSIANYAKAETGDPRMVKFQAARTAVSNELGRVFQGAGAVTESEKEEFRKSINSANSPEQLRGAIETFMDLVKSRNDALRANWDQTMSGVKPPTPFANEKTKKILKKHGYNPDTLEKEAAKQSAGLDLPSQGDIMAELKRRGL